VPPLSECRGSRRRGEVGVAGGACVPGLEGRLRVDADQADAVGRRCERTETATAVPWSSFLRDTCWVFQQGRVRPARELGVGRVQAGCRRSSRACPAPAACAAVRADLRDLSIRWRRVGVGPGRARLRANGASRFGLDRLDSAAQAKKRQQRRCGCAPDAPDPELGRDQLRARAPEKRLHRRVCPAELDEHPQCFPASRRESKELVPATRIRGQPPPQAPAGHRQNHTNPLTFAG
jgi:hypothetical protein